ncbi:MAG: S9 family peptidase [Bacteroidales bacterium]|nr:S9 family peptidase [Bacteroidales bacterium]
MIIRVLRATAVLLLAFVSGEVLAQENNSNFATQTVDRKVESLLLIERMSDVAYVDIVRLAGPAPAYQKKTGTAFKDSLLGNQLKFYSYVFIPKTAKQNKKYPLLVFPHGGVHSSFTSGSVHILREMVAQGYIVIAPDYRGSTGYGRGFYENIDYGGLENEDVMAARDYMVECYDIVDPDRVGIIGWSHGGMITLMNLLRYPEKFACGYAGVPVSDVGYRLSYQSPEYADNYTVPYHIGATPQEKPEEYARRSPVTYAKQLSKPLRIVTCANDDDVSVTEVQRMIDSLTFHNRAFEYKVFPKMPGAHSFERIDSMEACEIRLDTYAFLARYLNPPKPIKTIKDLRKAGYLFH